MTKILKLEKQKMSETCPKSLFFRHFKTLKKKEKKTEKKKNLNSCLRETQVLNIILEIKIHTKPTVLDHKLPKKKMDLYYSTSVLGKIGINNQG